MLRNREIRLIKNYKIYARVDATLDRDSEALKREFTGEGKYGLGEKRGTVLKGDGTV